MGSQGFKKLSLYGSLRGFNNCFLDEYEEEDDQATPARTSTAECRSFEWQLNDGQQWLHIDNDHVIEAHYCQPGAKGMTINSTAIGRVYIDFDCIGTQGSATGIRRLSFLSGGLAEDVGWYYRDDKLWQEYGFQGSSNSTDVVCSKVVEQRYSRDPGGTLRFTVGSSAYALDFSAMTQTNLATQMQRNVRRRPKFNTAVSANRSSSPSSPTAAPLAPSAGCTWEFMGEEGIWTEYEAHRCSLDSDAIESRYQQNPQGKLRFKAGRFSYTLDLSVMTQTNDAIGTQRAVRRIQGGQESSSRSQPRWQFNDMNGTWSDYTKRQGRGGCSLSSQDIEAQYQQDPNGTMAFTTRSFNYELDFSAMTQTNRSTCTTRAVRRLDQ